LRFWEWPVNVTEIHISRSTDLGEGTSLKPHRPVFVLDALKAERPPGTA
jgi:precorrin-6B methylase 2